VCREFFRTGRINREEAKKVGIRLISNGSNYHGFSMQKEGCACAACASTATDCANSISDGNPGNDSAGAVSDALMDDAECQ
jgi:hypothetical protein